MFEVNRARLLAVVNGDWTSYTRVKQVCHAPLEWEVNPSLVVNDIQETDFGLLRHDIHVLIHAATDAQDNSPPTGTPENKGG